MHGDPTQRRVVLTGGTGRIGRAITSGLGDRWDLVTTDLSRSEGVEALDVTDEPACRVMFAGADAVVHLAANPSPTAAWDELHGPNLVGTYVVAAAAVAAGVPRLVLASSLQAVSAYPADRQVRGGDPALPANLYGATKAWVEGVGSWVAASSNTEVVALRIGYFQEERPAPDVSARDRAAWLSPADAAELVRAAVEGPVEAFTVIGGVSANRYRKAEHGDAERRLGYSPVDDAWA